MIFCTTFCGDGFFTVFFILLLFVRMVRGRHGP